MKTLELSDLPKEEARTVIKVLNTVIGQDDSVQVRKNGKLLYDITKNQQSAQSGSDTSSVDFVQQPVLDNEQYVPQPGEKPSDVLERIFADGPLLDERYQEMSFEEFRLQAWGGRGVR